MVANSEVKRMARACSVIELMLWGIIENTQDKFHVYWSHMNFPPSKRKTKMTISCEQKNKTKKIFNFTFVLYGRSNLRTGLSTVIHRLETTLTHVDTHSDTHTHSHTEWNESRQRTSDGKQWWHQPSANISPGKIAVTTTTSTPPRDYRQLLPHGYKLHKHTHAQLAQLTE